jgi:hypothetical protein
MGVTMLVLLKRMTSVDKASIFGRMERYTMGHGRQAKWMVEKNIYFHIFLGPGETVW